VTASPAYEDDDVTVYAGDCLDVLRGLPDASVDAVVTDPPYGIEFMGKEWDRPVGQRVSEFRSNDGYERLEQPVWREAPAGAMRAYQEWCEAWARECLRVVKPGGHLLAFGGTRTYHRLATAVEDAGFEIRDSIDWIYAQGFPKSLNVGDGWGTALKPAHEPIVVARKQLRGTVAGNVAEHGVGALNIDGCRIAWGQDGDVSAARKAAGYTDAAKRALGTAVAAESTTGFSGEVVGTDSSAGRWPANVVLSHGPDCVARGTQRVATTTHYPATRPGGGLGNDGHVGQDGLVARQPGTEVVEAWDCAEGCPVRELDGQSGVRVSGAPPTRRGVDGVRGTFNPFAGQEAVEQARGSSAGGASRFFPTFRYEAKATPLERPTADGVMHPTVKPVALMQWLVRLVVPRGATVLDPFLGSGTTAEACVIEGMRCVGIEREPTYLPLIRARLRKAITPTLGLDL
jgi:DNA modification methylase